MTEKPWLSISQFAKAYGVARHTVYKWLDAQLLDTYRIDTVIRIRNMPPDQHTKRTREVTLPTTQP